MQSSKYKNKPIRALLLAGGLGTRLRPLTLKTPKCLVEISGIPLLKIWLDKLNKLGCEKVLINTHYLSSKVYLFLEKIKYENMEIHTTHENILLGTAGTLLKNTTFFKGSTGLLIHADNLTSDTLHNFLNSHYLRPNRCILSMISFVTENPQNCGILEVDRKGIVTKFLEKVSNPPSNLANGAIYAFEEQFLNYINSQEKHLFDLSKDVIPELIGRIYAIHTNELFLDIGNLESYKKAQVLWNPF